MSGMTLKCLNGPEAKPYILDIARIRMTVFRSFPYLYEGDFQYEAEYLKTYLGSSDSIVIIVRDGDRVVGAATGLPLDHQEVPEFQKPFLEKKIDVTPIFYFGESVLLKPYRGRGWGVRFFQEREAHARRLGRFDTIAFCSVDRPQDHPLRPVNYIPLDRFWMRRGFTCNPDLRGSLFWKDIDGEEESPKPMVFWTKKVEKD